MTVCDHVAWRRWLCLEYLIVFIVGSLSQRLCTNNNGFVENTRYFLGKDTEAYPVQYGDCSFGQSLCNYTQFCKDYDAEDWRQTGDHAECPGKTGVFNSFSVLLSPLLHISHVTCLTFEYTQEIPGTLSVYMATRILVFSVMPEENKLIPNFIAHKIELSNTTGKLAFRARSANTNDKVQLRGVKLMQGSCTGPACSFEAKNTPSTCGWTLDNWNITVQLIPENVIGATSNGYFVHVIYPTVKATLTTTLVQSTGSQTGCLEFGFMICGSELRLLVSIQSLDGNRRVVWVVSSNTSTVDCLQTWQHAAVPLSSSAAFTVIFENVPTDNSAGLVAVDSVRYTTLPSPSACPLEPQHALPRDDDVIWSLPLSSTHRLSGDISTVTESAVDNPRTKVTFRQSGLSSLVDVTTVLESQRGFSSSAAPVTHSPDTWKYQCEINENVTDILWILQSTNETETLSRCSVESESCDQRLEDLARATINSTSSFLYISDSFVGQKEGRVGYAEIINGLRGEIRFDARTNPMNRANGPLTETTEQTDASTDSPAGTDSLAAWQYQCQIRENVTDVLWILQVGNETETLSRCYIGSQSCDQRLDECAMATINRTSSLFNISANLEKEKAGRVGYAEIINGLNGEIRFDAKRNPIKWPCGPLTVTTGMFPSTKQTSDSTDYSTDYSTGRTSP